ncbi:MAG: Membrane proteins related to metalloendopeptidase [bacterium P3]|nr:MAG: Membrane proteins related to metalloendopeptidase [bacterium P3]KWW40738.1 MAG: Membrane proteins related to metalloendopeptidase [bacterium F083]
MLKYISSILFLALVVLLPATAQSQTDKPSQAEKDKQSVIKINKLDIIYPDDEYSGIVIDQKATTPEDESRIYEQPFIIAPPPVMDVDQPLHVLQPIDDEGAESEEEILYASFDSEVIHYPKMDVTNMEPVTIRLVDEARGETFHFPTGENARVTSHFGPRRRRFHYGLDLAEPKGEPIYAAFDGIVRISKFNRSYGNLVVIRHNNGLETYYAHLSRRDVVPGDPVKAGDIIGLCGNTGRSYGSHLHFEIRYQGNAMNPENVLDCATRSLIDNELYLTQNSFRKVAKKGSSNKGSHSSGDRRYYKVRSGDNLSKIAKRNGTTVQKLCQLNGIKQSSVLPVGKRIRIR